MNHWNKQRMSEENPPDDQNHEQPRDDQAAGPHAESASDLEQGPSAQPHTPEAKIEALQADLAQAKDQMLRAMAEAENTRKRLLREREDVRKYAISDFAKDLLDFADNFRRALGAIPPELQQADERIINVISGIEAMEKELLKNFEKHGIKKIEPMDEVFDPNFHEVMFEALGTGKPAGIIVQLIEPGYVLHDRLLRPARVGVAKDEGQGNGGSPPGGKIDTQA